MKRDYSLAQEQEAARELAALPAGAELREFMADYGVLRKQADDCWSR